jgi:hypothetical protein
MEKIDWAMAVSEEQDMLNRVAGNEELELSGAVLFGTEDPRDGREVDRFRLMLLTKFYGKDEQEVTLCKENFAQSVRIAAMACNAYASLFFSEVWTAMQDLREPLVPAGQRQDRQEAVMLIADHRDYGSVMHMASVLRDESGRSLAPWVTHGTGYRGRFTSLFPPCEIGLADRELARVMARRFGILDLNFEPGTVH